MAVKSKKVLVALSGGVDSSVAAVLLKKQGFEVYGLFMHFWSLPQEDYPPNKCCTPESEKVLRAVCSKLQIPLLVLDLKKQFKKEVVDYFISEYLAGRTPNPCVVCNKKIKFSFLLKKADELGCDFVATGHYARVKEKNGSLTLYKAKDSQKDQSYFLWQLSQKELSRIIFPIGEYKKEEVRKLAEKFNLATAQRPESQEICFVPQKDYRDFLKTLIEKEKIKKGPVFDKEGKLIGEHSGLIFYTLGQRKGFKVKVTNPAFDPFYVLKIDQAKNALWVGKFEDLYKKEIEVEKINWVEGEKPPFPLQCAVKIRYGAEEKPAKIIEKQGKLKIIFQKPVWAPTPGQSAVFYKGKEVVGGGVIRS